MRKVQAKYKGKKDQLSREAMSRETMALYKKHGTSPVGGCLPILIQMPIFFSLFWMLRDIQTWQVEGIGVLECAGRLVPHIFTNDLVEQFESSKLFGVAPSA